MKVVIRRFKFPVISRLTQAWLAFATLAGAVALYTASDDGRRSAAIAMTVEGIERIAPPKHGLTIADKIDRQFFDHQAAPSIENAATAEASGDETQDTLAGIDAGSYDYADPADDIVITVDGSPARAIGAAPSLASLTSLRIAEPEPELLKQTAYGRAPRIADDGRRAARVYAKPFAPGDDPSVALIVGGLGLNRALTERAIEELPPNVTLAFAPYAKDLAFWAKRAREAGHEFMIELPMENRSGEAEALGPAALLTSHNEAQNLQRLEWILSRTEGYFGVTNYLGAHFSADRNSINPILERVAAAGLAYVDDTGALKGRKARDVVTISRLIDPGFGAEKGRTERDLDTLEKAATRSGEALGKTYVNAETLQAIVEWADGLSSRGIALAPASAVLAIRASDS